jgi:hypothetical protein
MAGAMQSPGALIEFGDGARILSGEKKSAQMIAN